MGRNFAAGPKWLPGKVVEREGETMVKLKLDDGRTWRRHVDHVLQSQLPTENESVPLEDDPLTAPSEEQSPEVAVGETGEPRVIPISQPAVAQPRCSTQVTRPPDKLM